MQGTNAKADSSRADPAAPLAAFSERELYQMPEAAILHIVLAKIAVTHPNEKPLHTLAAVCEVKPQTISNWLGGNGTPTMAQWLLIYRAFQFRFIVDWMKTYWESYE